MLSKYDTLSAKILILLVVTGCHGGILHAADPANGPTVSRVYAVDYNVLAVEIIEGRLVRGEQVAYVPDPTDEFQPDGGDVLAWEDGEAKWVPKATKLFRRIDGKRTEIGYYIKSENVVSLHTKRLGAALSLDSISTPGNYLLTSADDSNFGSVGLSPLTAVRKSKPIDEGKYGKGQSIRHVIYLAFGQSFTVGITYSLSLGELNTQESMIEYTHGEPDRWTEVIHVNQVGYHPDNGFKRALLSLWKGTGGGHDYDHLVGQPFKVVDVFRDKVVHTGTITKLMDDAGIETQFSNGVNNARTSVYGLDFSPMDQIGLFRVEIDGLGCSHPFQVKGGAWLDAFRVSMKGMLHHRSGIELGPPFTEYTRPLCFHPDAGTRLLQTDALTVSGESDVIRESLARLADSAREVPEAWGGYMDAGDWDRRSGHLSTTYKHLELFELFPEYFESLVLSLPPNETGNAIPDLLDEALWNIEFYQRLQLPDGGVRGGVESTAHPRSGEASWQESLLVGVFAADAVSSYRFAANAAKAGRLLKPYDSQKAQQLIADAIDAWQWAEANQQATLDAVPENKLNGTRNDMDQNRALSAVELFHETGGMAYHMAFEEEISGMDSNAQLRERLRDALFAYANLPGGIGDTAIKESSRQAIIDLAEMALDFQSANPYGIATSNRYLPMIGYVGYFSVPGMIHLSLPRAHALTGDVRYLDGAVGACNFPNGANPDNLCYTTGIGMYFPSSPLHVDMHVIAAPVPAGITIYGPSDPAVEPSSSDWVHTWRLAGSMVPNSRTWPATESFVNLPDWPAMSEYTIHQTLGPNSYYWGYLAGAAAHPDGFQKGVAEDKDLDGLEDSVEYPIIEHDDRDSYISLVDVLPWQDFDGDGASNFDEMLAGNLAHIPGMGLFYAIPDYQGGIEFLFKQAESGSCQFQSTTDFRNWEPRGQAFDQVGSTHKLLVPNIVEASLFLQVRKQ